MIQQFTVIVWLGVAIGIYALLDLVFSEDKRVSRRLKGLTEYEVQQAKQSEPMLRSFRERAIMPFVGGIVNGARALWPKRYFASLSDKLDRAGYPRGVRIDRLVAAKSVLASALVLLTVAAGITGSWQLGATVFVMVLAGLLGFFAPDIWVDGQISRRQNAIVRQLPDTLDLLTISVEAGLGFDAALARIVKAFSGPLSEEFGRVLHVVQSGASRKEALRGFAERADVPEIHSFVASIVQADQFGVSISQVLRTQAGEMRLVRRQRAEELAQKAPVKMAIPLILCILPATMIVILGPAVIRIGGLFGG